VIVVNTDFIPGYEVAEMLGLVRGNTVRAKHVGKDIMASLRQIVGGEITGYTEMLSEAREEALARMAAEGAKLGADAVINTRFATSSVMASAAEILAYGTAVKLIGAGEIEDRGVGQGA
jgi:uncharacterized protein YbjQ (UPF0145 family)